MTVERVEPNATKKIKDTRHYSLESYHDLDHDTMFYQITRPNEDRSWTCVITNYKDRGDVPFFSSFFYLGSFGKSGHDIDFLSHCWHKWDMPGPFFVDALVKQHIDDCENDESKRPLVYQNEIQRLICIFNCNKWP